VPLEQEIIGRWYYRWYRESMELDRADPLESGDAR
jgi:hypothetical protein